MTAINFSLDSQQAFIATDTLVSGDGSELFTAKAWAFPHLRLAVAGCGQQDVVLSWLTTLLRGLPAGGDIDDLDDCAPEQLRRVWERTPGRPTTLYHLGANRRDEIVGFAYCSERGFRSEALVPGMYAHPCPDERRAAATESHDGAVTNIGTAPPPVRSPAWPEQVQACIEVMQRQRDLYPHAIGGRILSLHLNAYGIQQHWREFPVREPV